MSNHRKSRIGEDGRECGTCGDFKPWEDFYKNKRTGPSGHLPDCKDCTNQGRREAYRSEKAPSVVYFLGFDDYVKIGITQNLERRVRMLQTGNPHALTVMATMPGGAKKEAELHERFKTKKSGLLGEWFDLDDELWEFIHTVNEENLVYP